MIRMNLISDIGMMLLIVAVVALIAACDGSDKWTDERAACRATGEAHRYDLDSRSDMQDFVASIRSELDPDSNDDNYLRVQLTQMSAEWDERLSHLSYLLDHCYRRYESVSG